MHTDAFLMPLPIAAKLVTPTDQTPAGCVESNHSENTHANAHTHTHTHTNQSSSHRGGQSTLGINWRLE